MMEDMSSRPGSIDRPAWSKINTFTVEAVAPIWDYLLLNGTCLNPPQLAPSLMEALNRHRIVPGQVAVQVERVV